MVINCFILFSLFVVARSYQMGPLNFFGRANNAFRLAETKEFFVTKTVKDEAGIVKDIPVRCKCGDDKSFKSIVKNVGLLVDKNGTMLTNFSDIISGTRYSTMVDSATLHASVTNLIGNRESLARSAKLQV